MTTRYERQWTECEAIKSIYEKEYEEIVFPWKVDHPPCFKINLPAGISIEVRMTKNYPDELPELRVLRKGEEISSNQAKEMEKKIVSVAKQMLGSEMIYEVVEEAKTMLQKFNQPTSFHAEMLQRQEEQATKQSDLLAKNAQKLLDLEAQKKLEEMVTMERLIALELTKEKEQAVEKENLSVSTQSQSFAFNPPLIIDGVEVDRLICIAQLDAENFKVQAPAGDGPFLLVQHALPPFQNNRKVEMMIKVLAQHQLAPHENVQRVLGVNLHADRQYLSILQEFVEGSRLSEIVEQAGRIAPEQAFEYAKGIAGGLSHLHAAGLSHRALSLASVVVCKGSRTVKVSGYLTRRALLGDESESLQAPELRTRPNFESKAGDLWCLGIIVLEMLFGAGACKNDSFDSLLQLIPAEQLRNLCSQLLSPDPSKRPSASEVAKAEIIFPAQLITLHAPSPKPATPTPSAALTPSGPASSRYHADFEELEFLGRGGFGSVVKARNKIDNLVYAIKKVPLDPQNVDYNKKILREVTTLSRMHHERVIRYYQAWIESEGQKQAKSEASENDFTFTNETPQFSSEESDYSDIVFAAGSSGESDWESESQSTSESESFSKSESKFFSSTLHSNDTSTFQSDTKASSSAAGIKQFLYIQMEYCPNQTLRDLLDERATEGANATHILDPPELWRLFRQIVEGLAHIHAQGMMHRDLKPSNIFLDSNGDIKIGDFGLAVTKAENQEGTEAQPQQSQRASRNASVKFESSLTTNIGTPFYVSPEQYQPGTSRYNQKVDMYALGIILVELWCPFNTGMERVQALRDCRLELPRLPSSLPATVKQIAQRLLDHEPKKRFSSFELLKSDLLPPMLEAELLDDAVRTVAQPGTPQYPRLISTIFARQTELGLAAKKPKDFAFDIRSGNVSDLKALSRQTELQSQLQDLFMAHGAIAVNPPLLLIPLQEDASSASREYRVLDETGQLLQLPSELTCPFARFVAQSNIHVLKRFSFDRVFAKASSHFLGGQPHQTMQASFDIVSPRRENRIIPVLEAAECIKLAVELALASFKADSLTLKLGNAQLRSALLAGKVNVPDDFSLTSALPVTKSFSKSAYPEAAVLKATQATHESNEAFLKRLNAPDCLVSLLAVLKGLKVKVVLDPLMSTGIYTGNVFALLHEGRRSNFELLSHGGDYSDLVEEYRFPTARLESAGPVAFGALFHLEHLQVSPQPPQPQSALNCALLVPDSWSDDLVALHSELLRVASNVRLFAESEEAALLRQARSLSFSHIVQLRRSLVRVKTASGKQFDCPLGSLTAALERVDDGNENQAASASNEMLGMEAEAVNEQEFHFLLSGAKHQRTLLREKASKALAALRDIPVLIHEIPRDLLLAALDGKNSSVSAWKDAEERDLALKLPQTIKKLFEGKKPSLLCFYNHRDSTILKIDKFNLK